MPLRYLIDENLRGTLAVTLLRVATRYGLSIDVSQVGDDFTLPLGSLDPEILIGAEQQNRILISRDHRTLGRHLFAHLQAGHHSPGILLIRDEPLIQIAEYLILLAYASTPEEWHDQVTYIP